MDETRASAVLAIGRDRLFYSGLVGNSGKPRSLGTYTLYFATQDNIRIDTGHGWQTGTAVLVRPFQAHRLVAASGWIHQVGLEPESLSAAAIERLGHLGASADDMAILRVRVLRLVDRLTEPLSGRGFSSAQFDRLFFDQPFEAPQMDPRIARVAEAMCDDLADSADGAEDYARMVGLSPSRFLHLFKLNTGVSFRAMRMWKRARRFLDHANGSNSLTDVALDLGYPDSSHFSHSIRRIYGLKPRSIRQGSRHLRVLTGAGYTLAPEALAG